MTYCNVDYLTFTLHTHKSLTYLFSYLAEIIDNVVCKGYSDVVGHTQRLGNNA